MILSIIVAMSQNATIGKDNTMPWHLPADLKHFKSLTSGHPIIMGRKTYESIGRPLPNRTNIVISRNADFQAEGCHIVHTTAEAIELAAGQGSSEAFVIGGGNVYAQFLPLAHKIYLTRIAAEIAGDTFFPPRDETEWEVVEQNERPADEKNPYNLLFITYQRKNQ